jgi:hypothetical protein
MRTAAIAAETRRHRDELIGRVERADDIAGVFLAGSSKLRQLVPHDAAALIATDPRTGLPAGPARLEGVEIADELSLSAHTVRWVDACRQCADSIELLEDMLEDLRADVPPPVPDLAARSRTC